MVFTIFYLSFIGIRIEQKCVKLTFVVKGRSYYWSLLHSEDTDERMRRIDRRRDYWKDERNKVRVRTTSLFILRCGPE